MSYASAGQGAVSHLAGVLFSNRHLHGPCAVQRHRSVPGVLAGRARPVMFHSMESAKANSEAGKKSRRWPQFARTLDLTTLAEGGLPQADIMATFGIWNTCSAD